jgi:hypothetical protein
MTTTTFIATIAVTILALAALAFWDAGRNDE